MGRLVDVLRDRNEFLCPPCGRLCHTKDNILGKDGNQCWECHVCLNCNAEDQVRFLEAVGMWTLQIATPDQFLEMARKRREEMNAYRKEKGIAPEPPFMDWLWNQQELDRETNQLTYFTWEHWGSINAAPHVTTITLT